MNSILLDHLQKLVNEGITIEEAVILLLEYEAKFDVIVALYKTQPFNFKIVIETLEIKGFVTVKPENVINIDDEIQYFDNNFLSGLNPIPGEHGTFVLRIPKQINLFFPASALNFGYSLLKFG